MTCSICQKEIPVKEGGWDSGNNAQPVNDGRCCDDCNLNVVIPARMREMPGRDWEVEDSPGETGRLFATAPELLAACKKVIAAFGEKTFRPDLQADAINAVAAALAKAEGRGDG